MFNRFGSVLLLAVCGLFLWSSISLSAPPGDQSNWTLTFNDEFDGTSLDTTKWATKYIDGARTNNDELEWYVDDAENHVVSDGTLKLVAEKQVSQSGYPYTSGMISSHISFSQAYGYWEGRMKLPKGKGLWPALWMLPTPAAWPPEIDIMENLGNNVYTVYMTNHWANSSGGHQQNGGSYTGPDFSAGFHTLGVEWSSDLIVWYIDGVERFRSTSGVPSGKMHILANLAVGGFWPGNPDSSTIFPAVLEIDWIRVYKKEGSSTPVNLHVEISSPANGATVSGTVPVSANVNDSTNVAGVQFLIDGNNNLGSEDTSSPYSISWNTSKYSNEAHVIYARVRDTNGNTASSNPITVKVNNVADTVAPVISSISVSSISSSGVTVTWKTDEASDTQVEYGLTSSYGSQTTLKTALVTSHSQSISGLRSSTTYHYRVKSRDKAGNLAVSGDRIFTTARGGNWRG